MHKHSWKCKTHSGFLLSWHLTLSRLDTSKASEIESSQGGEITVQGVSRKMMLNSTTPTQGPGTPLPKGWF